MSSLPFVVAALLVVGGAVGLAGYQLLLVRRASSPGLSELVKSLHSSPRERRGPQLLQQARVGSWERGLGEALEQSPTAAARIAVANEAVAEWAQSMLIYDNFSRASVRLAIFGGMLVAILAFLLGDRVAAGICAGVGFAGALVGSRLGSMARQHQQRLTRTIDHLVDALVEGEPRIPRNRTGSKRRGMRAGSTR